jgi:uncharacterized membrane protein YfcA
MTFGFFALAALAVMLLGLAKSGLSGLGALAVPLMALVMPPLQAAAITLPIMVVQDWVSVYSFRHEINRRNLAILLPGALAGIVAAYFLAAKLSEDVVRLAIGIVSIGFVGVTLWRDRKLQAPPTRADVAPGMLWGWVAGFASFVSHAGGPPFLIYVMPQRLPPIAFAGTSAVFFAAVNLMKVLPYLWLGQFTRAGLGFSLTLLPLAIVATLAGVWIVRRVPQEKFYAIILVATFLLGVKLVWDAGRALLG